MNRIKKYFFRLLAVSLILSLAALLFNLLFSEKKDVSIVSEIVNNTDISRNGNVIKDVEFDVGEKYIDDFLNENLSILRQRYYTVTAKTEMLPEFFNISDFEKANLKISNTGTAPKILVFHTHSTERFVDSGEEMNEGIVGAGDRLCNLLESRYHIKCLHISESFDIVGGKPQIMGAYERMEPRIRQVLNDNPSIELVIDMHRDGVSENTHLVKNINGKPTAEIMFFNGLCLLKENGKLIQPEGLSNPYLKTNLALSYRLKVNSDKMYPGLTRKIYLNAYRYSLHMKPLSTLIEVGAQTNTKEEIYNAIDLLADIIAETVT